MYGYAADVLYAGKKAVEIEPDNGIYQDTRGLARALTGDITGAIEDFKAVVDSEYFNNREELKKKRQGWLDMLLRGDNPFTPEEIEKLRQEG